MKKLLTALLLTVATAASAESTITTETTTWKSVPITVDATTGTYTTTMEGPATGDYYYSYSGYRCFKEKRTIVGVDPITYRATTQGGEIYCYPE